MLNDVFPVMNAPFVRSSRKQELEGKRRVKGTTVTRNMKWTAKAQTPVEWMWIPCMALLLPSE